jgi:hypothetical protein
MVHHVVELYSLLNGTALLRHNIFSVDIRGLLIRRNETDMTAEIKLVKVQKRLCDVILLITLRSWANSVCRWATRGSPTDGAMSVILSMVL